MSLTFQCNVNLYIACSYLNAVTIIEVVYHSIRNNVQTFIN